MGNRRKQRNVNVNNHTREELMDSKGNETSVFKFKRMVIIKFKDFKTDIQKQVNEFQENVDESWECNAHACNPSYS
jgi:hypothetical protein